MRPPLLPTAALWFLLAATADVAPLSILIRKLHLDGLLRPWVGFNDLLLLPFCLLLVGGAAGAIPPVTRRVALLAAAPVFGTLLLAPLLGRSPLDPYWQAPFVLVTLGLICLALPDSGAWLRRLAPLGAISYALYLFHMPIMRLIEHMFPGHYLLTVIALPPLALGAAWWLETALHPYLVARWRRVLSP